MVGAAPTPDAGDAFAADLNERGFITSKSRRGSNEFDSGSRRFRFAGNESCAGSKQFYLEWKEFCSEANEFHLKWNEFYPKWKEFYFESNEFHLKSNEFYFEWNEFYLEPNEFDSACGEFQSGPRSRSDGPRRRTIDVRHCLGRNDGASMAAWPAARGDARHLRPARAATFRPERASDVLARAAASRTGSPPDAGSPPDRRVARHR